MDVIRVKSLATPLAGCLCLCAMAANAEPRWYVSGGLTATKLETDGLPELAASEGLDASGEASDTAIGFQLGAGVMLTDNFGFELKYSDSGEGDDDVFFTDGIDVALVNIDTSIDGITIYGVGQTSISPAWDIFGKLGITMQDATVSFDILGFGSLGSFSEDDDGLALAAGLRYRMTPNWAITGELEYFTVDFGGLGEPLRGSLNIQYLFTATK